MKSIRDIFLYQPSLVLTIAFFALVGCLLIFDPEKANNTKVNELEQRILILETELEAANMAKQEFYELFTDCNSNR